ncbi:GntR family transcriptional regulator [Fictibacillus enclensis]|uniref:GntR family transcriptional regulator n=1 Tax=Fictibacillus enclensis TaxID=1017270 RepID=UPI0025A020EA|nr:GntR family transcriptional regulator [Fictibacillus enclensis]MDM5200585.1 GntR family transcriptional regulator [Fictibacillus enclensis]
MKQAFDYATLQEKVTAMIRESIFKKEYKPGERLVQDELAQKLGVSRMPIREALRCLEREGLVEMLPHKGAQVIGITKEDIEELYYLRSMFEGITVQKSMNFLTEQDIWNLKVLIEQMDQDIEENNLDSYIKHNQEFHVLIQKGCNWKKIKKLCSEFINGYAAHLPSLVPETMQVSNEEHKLMLQAIEDKDPIKLRQMMELHITRSGSALTRLLE